MNDRRRMRLADAMLLVGLIAVVGLVLRQPLLRANPMDLPSILGDPSNRADPTLWLCPTVVTMTAAVLFGLSVASRLTTGRARAFLGGSAVGGWFFFLLAFTVGIDYDLSHAFLPIGRTDVYKWNDLMTARIWGLPTSPWDWGRMGTGWAEACARTGRLVESAVCLLFAVSTGLASSQVARWSMPGWRSRVFVGLRGMTLSGWMIVIVAGLVWKYPKASLEPLVTMTLSLYLFALVLACFGPPSRRLESVAFGVVGLAVLTTAFSSFMTGPASMTPTEQLCVALTRRLHPGQPDSVIDLHRVRIENDVHLTVTLSAWFVALASARVARLFGVPAPILSRPPRGEPCPS